MPNTPVATIPIVIDMSNVPRQVAAGIQAAQASAPTLQLKVDSRPLGKISGDLKEFDKSLASSNARVIAFGATTGILYGVSRAFTEIVSTTIDVEKKLQDINVILQASGQNFTKLRSGLFDIAAQTGKSFDEAATAAAEFSRQGLGLQETLRRTKDALTLSRLAAIDSKEAVSDLTAAVNTFNKEALDSTSIVNKLATVDAAFAVSSADLAEAIKRAGAAAADSGVNFDKLVAAVTSVQQTTARGGAVIGNAFKSIFTRVERSTNLETLRQLGVSIKDVEGNTRPAIDILEDFSKVYVRLGDAQKAQVSEQLAGIQQINVFKALLNDLSRSNSVYTQSLEISTKALDEARHRQDELNTSTSALINKTKANIGNLFSGLGSGAVEPALRGILNAFNGIFDKLKANLGSTNLDEAQKGFGEKIGRGIIDGISGVLSGPGLVVLLAVFGRLFLKVGEFVGKAGLQLAGVNSTAEKQAKLQGSINELLASGNTYYQQRINNAKSLEERERVILSLIEQQNALLQSNRSAGAASAANLYGQGVRGGTREGGKLTEPFTSPGEGILRGLFRRPIAGGYLPDMVGKEQAAINKGVGGASSSARPVLVPNFNFGGGKMGDVIANTNEYIVKNFAGGDGSAVFNPNMIRNIGGLESLSNYGNIEKIAADGLIPDYAESTRGRSIYRMTDTARPSSPKDKTGEFYGHSPGAVAGFEGSTRVLKEQSLNKSAKGYYATQNKHSLARELGLTTKQDEEDILKLTGGGEAYHRVIDEKLATHFRGKGFDYYELNKGSELVALTENAFHKPKTLAAGYYPNFHENQVPSYASLNRFLPTNKRELFSLRSNLQKKMQKLSGIEREKCNLELTKIDKRIKSVSGPDDIGAAEGFISNYAGKPYYASLSALDSLFGDAARKNSLVSSSLLRHTKPEELHQAGKELGLEFREVFHGTNDLGFYDPAHNGNITIPSGVNFDYLRQERDFNRKLFNTEDKDLREKFRLEREKTDPLYAQTRDRLREDAGPGGLVAARGFIPKYKIQERVGTGSIESEVNIGDKTLKAVINSSGNIGFGESNVSGLGRTGIGAFKTMNALVPHIKELVKFKLDQNPDQKFHFDADPKKAKLYQRYLSKLGIKAQPSIPFSIPSSVLDSLAGGFPKGLSQAIKRETKFVSKDKIYVDKDKRLKTPENPLGLLVANKKDEPLGGYQGVDRAIKEGRDPNKYGKENRSLAYGNIPNFAPPLVPGSGAIFGNPLVGAGGFFENLSAKMQARIEERLNKIDIGNIDFTKGAEKVREQLRVAIKSKLAIATQDLDLERTPEGVRLSRSIGRLVQRTEDIRRPELEGEAERQSKVGTRSQVRREFIQASRNERDATELQSLRDQLGVGDSLSTPQKRRFTSLTRKELESNLDPKFLALKTGDQYDKQLFSKIVDARVKTQVASVLEQSSSVNTNRQIGSFFGKQGGGLLSAFRSEGGIRNKFESQFGSIKDLAPQQRIAFEDNLAGLRRENVGRRQQIGLGAAFALPFLANTVSSSLSIGRDDKGNLTPKGRQVQGGIEGLSVGASIAGLLPTPAGVAIGAVTAAFVTLKSVTDNLTKNFEDFSREVDESTKKTSEEADLITQGIQSFGNFKEVLSNLRSGEGGPTRERATRQVVESFQQLPGQFQGKFLNAIASGSDSDQKLADLQEGVLNRRNETSRTGDATKRAFESLDRTGGGFFGGRRASIAQAFNPEESTGIGGFFQRLRFNTLSENPFTNNSLVQAEAGLVNPSLAKAPKEKDIRERLGSLSSKDLTEIKDQTNLLPVTAEGAKKGVEAAPRILKALRENKINPEAGFELFLKASGTDPENAARFAEVLKTATFADVQQVFTSRLKNLRQVSKADEVAKAAADVQQKIADFSTVTKDILKDLAYQVSTANTKATRQKTLALENVTSRIDIATPTLNPTALANVNFRARTAQNNITAQNDIGEAVSKGLEKIKIDNPAVLQDAKVAGVIARSIKEASADPSKINDILERVASSVDEFAKKGSGEQLGVKVRSENKDIAKEVQDIQSRRDFENSRASQQKDLDFLKIRKNNEAGFLGGDFTQLKNFDFSTIIKGIQSLNQIPLNKPIINNRFNPLSGQIERGEDFRSERGRSVEQGTDIVALGKQLSQLKLIRENSPLQEKFRGVAEETNKNAFNDFLDRVLDIKGLPPDIRKEISTNRKDLVEGASKEQSSRQFQKTGDDAINDLIAAIEKDIAAQDEKNNPLLENTKTITDNIIELKGLHEGTTSLIKVQTDLTAAIQALTEKLGGAKQPDSSQVPDYLNPDTKPDTGFGDRLLKSLGGFSKGYLPNFNAYGNEMTAIKRGIGGALSGDVPSYANIKGLGPSVVNTGETIVRNFMDTGKDAIFNRNMKRDVGLPLNLLGTPENAYNGHIPNFISPANDTPFDAGDYSRGPLANLKSVRKKEVEETGKKRAPQTSISSGKTEELYKKTYLDKDGYYKATGHIPNFASDAELEFKSTHPTEELTPIAQRKFGDKNKLTDTELERRSISSSVVNKISSLSSLQKGGRNAGVEDVLNGAFSNNREFNFSNSLTSNILSTISGSSRKDLQKFDKETGIANRYTVGNPKGLLRGGNLDLTNRPIVKNKDSSFSTVRSASFNIDGREILIPTTSKDGTRILSNDNAIKQYRETNQNLGIFSSANDATAYAKDLHQQQSKLYKPGKSTEQIYKEAYLSKDGYYKARGFLPNFANEDLPPGLPDHYYVRTGKPKAIPTPAPTATPIPYTPRKDFPERKFIENLLASQSPTPAPTPLAGVNKGASKSELDAFDKAIQKTNEENTRPKTGKARGYVPNFISSLEDALANSSSLRNAYSLDRGPLNKSVNNSGLSEVNRLIFGLRQNYITQNNPLSSLSPISGQPRLPLSVNEVPDIDEVTRYPFLIPPNSGLFKRRTHRHAQSYDQTEGALIGDRARAIASKSGEDRFSDFIFKIAKGKNPDYATNYGPNFPTGYIPALGEALNREASALSNRGVSNPEKHLFVGRSSGILGVGNTIDETDGLFNPNAGIQQGINRYIKSGLNPSTAGQASNYAAGDSDTLISAINNLIVKLAAITDSKAGSEAGKKSENETGAGEVRHTGSFTVDVALKGGDNGAISQDVNSQIQAALQSFKDDLNNRLSSLEKSNGQIPTPPLLQSSAGAQGNVLV